MRHEHGNANAIANVAEFWETSVAPKIVRYVARTNAEHYARALGSRAPPSPDDANAISTAALLVVPHLARRLHRETNTKLTYLIAQIEVSRLSKVSTKIFLLKNTFLHLKFQTLDDAHILNFMRERGDSGPIIFNSADAYRIVVVSFIVG